MRGRFRFADCGRSFGALCCDIARFEDCQNFTGAHAAVRQQRHLCDLCGNPWADRRVALRDQRRNSGDLARDRSAFGFCNLNADLDVRLFRIRRMMAAPPPQNRDDEQNDRGGDAENSPGHWPTASSRCARAAW